MPLDSGIGTLPYPHQTVGGVARLLDYEGLQAQAQPLFLARDNEVLAHRARRRLGSELQESGARDHRLSLDRLKVLRGGNAGYLRALARGDPAAVDQNVHTPALRPERRQDLIADGAAHDLVIEEERVARHEAPAGGDTTVLEARGVHAH